MTLDALPSGVLAALATPLGPDRELDRAGLERLIAHVLGGGAGGLSPIGSTGEGTRLSRRQRVDVVRHVRALAPPGIPVVAGVPVSDELDAPDQLAAIADAGADAALVSLTAGYPLADGDVERCYERLAASSPLPLVLYNIPAFTGIRIDPGVVGRLAAHPNVVGIKDSSRDMEYLQQVVFATAGARFSVLTGTDTLLLASLTVGAVGTIAASVNLVPHLSVGVHRAFIAGDLATARREQELLARVVHACRVGASPSGWKASLAIAGLCGPYLAPPASPLPEPQYGELARTLADLGVAR